MDNMYMKCKCKNIIPQARVLLGYKVCIDCSTIEQYGCAPLTNKLWVYRIQQWRRYKRMV